MKSLSLEIHNQITYSQSINLCYTILQKKKSCRRFYCAQMQLTKPSQLKFIHTPGKNLSDMLSRSFTKTELQLNQLKHKQLPYLCRFLPRFFLRHTPKDLLWPVFPKKILLYYKTTL